jgi:NADPH:quinone reductase
MHLREIPTPIPRESEVLIRVAVTGVNFIDLFVRKGRYGNKLPFTPGQEAAGTVVAVGKSVSHLQEGDRVAWCSVLTGKLLLLPALSGCSPNDLALN